MKQHIALLIALLTTSVCSGAPLREVIVSHADDNGILDAEEYAFFDEARASSHDGEEKGGHGGERKAAVGMTLPFNDINADGSVSMEEFIGQSAAWLALVDRNGDGVVTKNDFGPNR